MEPIATQDPTTTAPVDLDYRLDDNLTRTSGRIFLTGTQALVRLLLAQKRADEARGLNTAGYVSGYRGSPLAALDLQMWRAREALETHDIRFLPGVNEDLAATMMLGTQQVGLADDRRVDGVFSMWYGKGPGVDRAGDALHHGNAAGASRHGGVLLVIGDDHAATSSTIPHGSDLSLMGWGVPIVHPSSVAEYEAFGLWGWALSRFSSTWVAFKAISEVVESGRSFDVEPVAPLVDVAFESRVGSLEFRTTDYLTPAIEVRLAEKLRAVAAFARANSIDKTIAAAPGATLGIVTVGKVHHDVMDALRRLGLPADRLDAAGIRVYKPGLVYPLDRSRIEAFADGLEHILVVEEKASVVEAQVKEILFNRDARPQVVGKNDASGRPLVTWLAQLRPSALVPVLAGWLADAGRSEFAVDGCALAPQALGASAADGMRRTPFFCSGCPHNTSTRVPEGSRAQAGVGCHYMAAWMDRDNGGLTQMGGEGADWVGSASFRTTAHVFQNMGEGTYFHSGHLAIRQAIAAKTVNITYKILFNDAVAMTGGQPVDGAISVPRIVQQMTHEGAKRVVVVTDEPERYRDVDLGARVDVHHRRELDRIQRELREITGVTVLVYDQTCAAEKRRRRKRDAYPDPARRMVINTEVCEGCGDCGVQSNCLSVVPVETPLGRKRAIDQSSCNKDYSCVEGFCPSFVSVIGGRLRRGAREAAWSDDELARRVGALPLPALPSIAASWNVLVGGVGGTGILTIGALVSMAAHLEGRGATVLDFASVAQKGGPVISHIRIAPTPADLDPVRIEWQQADALIVSDAIVGNLPDAIGTIRRDHTRVVVNTHVAPIGEFTRRPDLDLQGPALVDKLRGAAGAASVHALDASAIVDRRLGDSIGVNMFLLGYAWQAGWVPVSLAALERAIELNAVSVDLNRRAFAYGRLACGDPKALDEPKSAQVIAFQRPETLAIVVERAVAHLSAYQDAAYAERYRGFVDHVAAVERAASGGAAPLAFTEAVARSLHKLMAYKDEYEVARLFSDGSFERQVADRFEGDYTLRFHLAPPLVARRDPRTGHLQKRVFGPSTLTLFKLLARLRRLRSTPFDVFGYTRERRGERAAIDDYRALVEALLPRLGSAPRATLLELARLPMAMRGYGHVKERNVAEAAARRDALMGALDAPSGPTVTERRRAV